MKECVPTIGEHLVQIAEINKIRASGPVSEEQKEILERFGAELEFYDNYWSILIISNTAVPLE